MVTVTRTTRTFQPRQQPEETDIWYTPIPLQVMWGVYARQSTQAQIIKNAESTEMQTDDLVQWLVDRGVQKGSWQLFDADLGVSGTLRIDQRTGLQELVERIRADEIKAVLVYQISRLFRDDTGVQYNTFAEICKKHNCVLVTADGMVFNFNNRMHLKMFRFLAEYAAEYIPQQIGLLHNARRRKARKGLYAGLGIVPTGYIVDYDKHSKTYKKLIPYWPHGEKVLEYLERYYELEADMGLLCRELDELPYLFPPFEKWVDPRIPNHKRWKRREMPGGGYGITRKGLELLLCNPVLVGWWIVEGDIISRHNHDPIVDKKHEYLFWYAFEHLSPYNIDGTVNERREREPRRFFQKDTTEEPGLLKKRISSPGCRVHVHVFGRVKAHYTLIPEEGGLVRQGLSDIAADIVDSAFTDRFLERLQETHEFDEYRRWITKTTEKHLALVENINTQLAEIDRQQEALLDEKLAIRSEINERIRQARTQDPTANAEQLKACLEKEAAPDLERIQKRSDKLKNLALELKAKLPNEEEVKELQTAREYQDFQTEVRKLTPVWHKKPIQVRREFVNLFVREAILEVSSAHWVSLTVHWRHPAWESDVLYIYRKNGPQQIWTAEERDALYRYYPTARREDILAILPLKSWSSIMHEARNRYIPRTVAATCILPEHITWSDWQFMQEQGIEPNDRRTKCVSLSAHNRS